MRGVQVVGAVWQSVRGLINSGGHSSCDGIIKGIFLAATETLGIEPEHPLSTGTAHNIIGTQQDHALGHGDSSNKDGVGA